MPVAASGSSRHPSSFPLDAAHIYPWRPPPERQVMFATCEELQRRLTKLEANMPWLVKEYPDPADFFPEFAGYADEITDHAGPEDDEWASGELSRILIKFGHVDDFAN